MERAISLIKARADTAKAMAKVKYYQTIETLQHNSDAAKTKLLELDAAGDAAWEDLKSGSQRAWDDIETAFQEALAKSK